MDDDAGLIDLDRIEASNVSLWDSRDLGITTHRGLVDTRQTPFADDPSSASSVGSRDSGGLLLDGGGALGGARGGEDRSLWPRAGHVPMTGDGNGESAMPLLAASEPNLAILPLDEALDDVQPYLAEGIADRTPSPITEADYNDAGDDDTSDEDEGEDDGGGDGDGDSRTGKVLHGSGDEAVLRNDDVGGGEGGSRRRRDAIPMRPQSLVQPPALPFRVNRQLFNSTLAHQQRLSQTKHEGRAAAATAAAAVTAAVAAPRLGPSPAPSPSPSPSLSPSLSPSQPPWPCDPVAASLSPPPAISCGGVRSITQPGASCVPGIAPLNVPLATRRGGNSDRDDNRDDFSDGSNDGDGGHRCSRHRPCGRRRRRLAAGAHPHHNNCVARASNADTDRPHGVGIARRHAHPSLGPAVAAIVVVDAASDNKPDRHAAACAARPACHRLVVLAAAGAYGHQSVAPSPRHAPRPALVLPSPPCAGPGDGGTPVAVESYRAASRGRLSLRVARRAGRRVVALALIVGRGLAAPAHVAGGVATGATEHRPDGRDARLAADGRSAADGHLAGARRHEREPAELRGERF
ncbi:hypothetical protein CAUPRSCDRAFT_10684 [Caulochytrium protostelioides]|uniref:Uncharacterized protein n=1 Tax=Caulochytrium protostelioides TaxID=1555241 RepID=A0A4P9X0X6_9FUNG|nr:hypothetical protein CAUPRSCDRAFT_10684 [Caulochytrium protostelioides]